MRRGPKGRFLNMAKKRAWKSKERKGLRDSTRKGDKSEEKG